MLVGAYAAALAGCGQGEDAGELTDQDRARWRQQAGSWLKAVTTAWVRQLESRTPADRVTAVRELRLIRKRPEFAGVRDLDALARLPEKEWVVWRRLCDDVDKAIAKAAETAAANGIAMHPFTGRW
jgi:hypothetical protein